MNRRKGLTTLFMFIHYYVEETEIRGGKTGRRLSTKKSVLNIYKIFELS